MEVEEERLDKSGGGGGKSYLSRAVARARILNNSYRRKSRERCAHKAFPEHSFSSANDLASLRAGEILHVRFERFLTSDDSTQR